MTSVLVISQLFYPELISSGQTVTELCEALSDSGEQVEVWCGQPTIVDSDTKVPRYLFYRGIHIFRLWGSQFPKLNLVGKLLNHLSFSLSVCIKLLFYPRNIPVIVFTNPPFLWIFVAWINRFYHRPTLQVVFDVYPQTLVSCGLLLPFNPIVKAWHWLNTIGFQAVSNIIVLGRCMATVISSSIPGSLQAKIVTIPLWCDLAHFAGVSSVDFRKIWGLEDKFVLLYSGNMGWFHDIETFAHAALQLRDQDDIRWVFVGDGKKKKWLNEFVTTHALQATILIKSYVPRDQLSALLSIADVGLVSLLESQLGLSVPSKTFGLMASGVPILGVLPETCEISLLLLESHSGLVVHPEDVKGLVAAVLNLRRSLMLRREMGVRGQALVRSRYTVAHAASLYQALLRPSV